MNYIKLKASVPYNNEFGLSYMSVTKDYMIDCPITADLKYFELLEELRNYPEKTIGRVDWNINHEIYRCLIREDN